MIGTKISGEKTLGSEVNIWQVVMLFLCVYVLAALFVQTIFDLPDDIDTILNQIDNGVCFIFIADFAWNVLRAERKRGYLKWGWIDLISSIPNVQILRWGRFARVIRILRILRGVRSTKLIILFLFQNRAKSAFASAVLISFVLVVFGSIAVLNCESGPDANIKTANDALWWAFITITTVGYGDYYPITTLGRIIAVMLIMAGIGLVGTFTAYVASFFLTPELEKEQESSAEQQVEIEVILQELREIKHRLERIEYQHSRQSGPDTR